MIHILKTWPEQYAKIRAGRKLFELRVNDRSFSIGDELKIVEFNPQSKNYTSRGKSEYLSAFVTDVLYGGSFGLPHELCIMSFHNPLVIKESIVK